MCFPFRITLVSCALDMNRSWPLDPLLMGDFTQILSFMDGILLFLPKIKLQMRRAMDRRSQGSAGNEGCPPPRTTARLSSALSVLLPTLNPVTEHSCAPLVTVLYILIFLLSGVSLL